MRYEYFVKIGLVVLDLHYRSFISRILYFYAACIGLVELSVFFILTDTDSISDISVP